MTNEEKAYQLEKENMGCPYSAALKMAGWKDQQFKEYLEKKKAEMKKKQESYHSAIIQASNAGGILTIDEIIYELFKED